MIKAETATIISGKEISARIREQLKVDIERIKKQGVVPGIAVILIGDELLLMLASIGWMESS